MIDINKVINDEALQRHDSEGHMYGLEHWSPLTAKRLAREEGIEELTEAHWHVIYALRNLYSERERSASAREVTHILEKDFVDEGGRRFLYELFPKGPVSQGSRLAGIPAPPNSSDPSVRLGWLTEKLARVRDVSSYLHLSAPKGENHEHSGYVDLYTPGIGYTKKNRLGKKGRRPGWS